MYEKCPNGCNSFFSCELDTENNQIVYNCAVCDWIEIEHKPFHVSSWVVSVNQALAPIDIVQSLLTNEDSIEFLRPRLKGLSHLSDRNNSLWKFTVAHDDYLSGEIDIAYQIYLRQMIILANTYVELIIKDFFESCKEAKSSILISLLAKDKTFSKKAMEAVTFDKVMNGDAKEEMIKHALSSISVKDRLRIIECLAKHASLTMDHKSIFENIKNLVRTRNDIAHNNLYSPFDDQALTIQDIYKQFRLISNFLYVLEKVAEQNGIPYWKDFDNEFDEFLG